MKDVRHTAPTSPWYVSRYSNNGANCLETRKHGTAGMAVRDSKLDSRGPVQTFPAQAWNDFVASLNV